MLSILYLKTKQKKSFAFADIPVPSAAVFPSPDRKIHTAKQTLQFWNVEVVGIVNGTYSYLTCTAFQSLHKCCMSVNTDVHTGTHFDGTNVRTSCQHGNHVVGAAPNYVHIKMMTHF